MTDNNQPWDDVFKQEGRFFQEPHEDVIRLCENLQPAAGKRVLDLGSGSGRHIVYLAKQGFATYGVDNSTHGLELTKRWLAEETLEAELQFADITKGLPFADDFFDVLISIQVIHHAPIETIAFMISEIARVVKPGATIFVTVPAKKNQAKTYKKIAPNTYVPLDGREKGLPHYYFDEAQLRKSFAQFEIQNIHIDSVDHYCLQAVLRP